MKKSVLAASSFLLLLVSCNKESHFESTSVYQVANLMIPSDAGKTPYVTNGNYQFKFVDGNIESMSTTDLVINNATTYFATGPLTTHSASTSAGGIIGFSGNGGMVNGIPVSDINGSISGIFNYVNRPVIGITQIIPAQYGPMLFMSYNIGTDYKVKTFYNDIYFNGTTKTEYSYKGEDKTYETTGILYRLVFKNGYSKADLIIYDGKFAAEQPSQGVYDYMVLQNLPVVWSANGYEISASDVVPQYEEAGKLEPQARFVFNNINLKNSSDDLSQCKIDYTVAGMYKGSFNGSCAVTNIW